MEPLHTPGAANGGAPLLAGEGLGKSFGANRAVDDVSLGLYAGEVHALAGENGSGKSTVLRCLAGAHRPDQGRLLMNGNEVSWGSIRAASNRGVCLVSQELSLVPRMTVADNVMLAHAQVGRYGIANRRMINQLAREYLDRVGLDIPLTALISELPIHQRQLIEIARALSMDPQVLLLDEPTSSLERAEAEVVLALARSLADDGMAVAFISHRMQELIDISDRVTVMRDGKVTGRREPGSEWDGEWVTAAMVGRDIDLSRRAKPLSGRETLLEVDGLSDSDGRVREVSLSVARGEIVGLAGLVGAGRTEFLETLYGARPRGAGTVRLNTRELPASSIRAAMDIGMYLIPDDRLGKSLVPTMNVAENTFLVHEPRGYLRSPREEEKGARGLAKRMGISVADVRNRIGSLSGGNQQKTIFARYLRQSPAVLLLDEPTRGIDIAAKAAIYSLLDELSADGMGVLVASSELEELMQLCHRVLVMFEGRIVAEFAQDQLTEDAIAAAATGLVAA
ncbi:sugar ABC transporter ATP-binding protein [Streptosporangium sp. NPDC049644]|uniref:sugar ABC transporter ATP-binding protein n=1 Tax=Streptosporangium sp. NPDC049644 TaxID=3155507 RepID=UPI003428F527